MDVTKREKMYWVAIGIMLIPTMWGISSILDDRVICAAARAAGIIG